jgi:hypothetical protein
VIDDDSGPVVPDTGPPEPPEPGGPPDADAEELALLEDELARIEADLRALDEEDR